MRIAIAYGLRISILLYTLAHIIYSFSEHPQLLQVLSISGIAMIIFALLSIPISDLKLPIFILIIATTILLFADANPLYGLFVGVREMRNIIGLLVVIPLIKWVLQEENYVEDMMSVFNKFINTSKKFYFSLVSLTQILAYFLLFASIPTMYQLTDVFFKDRKVDMWEYYKGTALLRGFSLSTLWVVTIPSFIVVVDTLNASIYLSIAQGFGIALVGTLIAVLFMALEERRRDVKLTPIIQEEMDHILLDASTDEKAKKKNVIEFILLFVSLFGTIFLIYGIWNIPLLILIPLVIIVWMFFFYIYKQRTYKFKMIAQQYLSEGLKNQTSSLVLMLIIGVLIYSLNQTNFAVNVVEGINTLESYVSWLNPLYLLPFIVIILGMLGLGPLTVMVLVAGILNSLSLPYPPELIVLAITSGSVISILISPLILPLIVLSAANGLSSFTNGVKFNWKFGLVFYIVTQIYIQIMVQFIVN